MHPSSERLVNVLKKAPKSRLRPLLERHGLKPSEGPRELVREIELDGSNTVASIFRGFSGVPYQEVVRDVAAKLGIPSSPDDPEEEIELKCLEKTLTRYLEQATREQRDSIISDIEKAGVLKGSSAEQMVSAIKHGTIPGGSLKNNMDEIGRAHTVHFLLTPLILAIAGNVALLPLKRKAGAAAAFSAALALGLGSIIGVTVVWAAIDAFGPAFRKTIPTVLEIALLRLEYAGR